MPLLESQFQPLAWAKNPHIQTILPRLLPRPVLGQAHTERIELSDGDFVDAVWVHREQLGKKPCTLVLHGLAGSVNSPYALHLLKHFELAGYPAVLMHFRGCSHEHNRTATSYHAAQIEDVAYLVKLIRARSRKSPVFGVGFSLGGNILLNYLATYTKAMERAVAVAPPMMLDSCAERINQGFSKIYQRYLLGKMRAGLHRKWERGIFVSYPQFSPALFKTLTTFRRFDDVITAPLHGFNNVDDYYRQASAKSRLGQIVTQTLIIHAKDDPFMDGRVEPRLAELPDNLFYELSEYGGHVGFVGGHGSKPRHWLNLRILNFLLA
ncbi:MAG: hydrolase [Kangiellaceae bacterium]|jgi:predicted alpha/beta-fold hydrolase|nr:hydrolase [Kangiellaceae bacterium]|tara:strand:+ start:7428 stop:8396 length:969 start_codon:yes stop_codon:yes gene_type:complete